MGLRERLSNLAERILGPVIKRHVKAAVGTSLRAAMSSDQPGAWASDHRTESEKFTGWNRIAIHSIALQAAGADVCAYNDTTGALRKWRTKNSTGRQKSYQKDNPDAVPLPADDRLSKLLKTPNPTQSAGLFNYERVLQLQLTGSAMVWNVKSMAGKTVERYVLPTAICQPVRPTSEIPQGGWRVSPDAARTYAADGFFQLGALQLVMGKIIPAEDIQVTRWPHPVVKDDGQSPTSASAMWIDTADMIDQSRWAHLHNGPDPSILIEMPEGWDGDEADLDRAATKMNAKYQGPKNTGKAMFTTGAKVTKLTTDAQKMAYGEGFDQLRDATLATHGVSGVAAGVTDGGSYAAFYASLLQTRTLTVQPILDILSDDDVRTLSKEFGPAIMVEMIAPSIEDLELLERQLANDLAAGVRTVDEWRSLRGLDPLGGERGEKIVGGPAPVPQGLLSGMGQPPGQPPARTEAETGFPSLPAMVANGKSHNGHGRMPWLYKNCGTGDGGFQSGNDCQDGGGGGGTATRGRVRRGRSAPPKEKTSARAARAKASYNPSTKAKQDASEKMEVSVATKLGAKKSGDNKPMDVVLDDRHGVEIKVLHDAKEGRVNMRPDSRKRKEQWAKETKGTLHTVIFDNRDKFDGGKHKGNYSGHKIYYKSGVGAYRLDTMTKVGSFDELKKLIRSGK